MLYNLQKLKPTHEARADSNSTFSLTTPLQKSPWNPKSYSVNMFDVISSSIVIFMFTISSHKLLTETTHD
jgi:hypothetical protein